MKINHHHHYPPLWKNIFFSTSTLQEQQKGTQPEHEEWTLSLVHPGHPQRDRFLVFSLRSAPGSEAYNGYYHRKMLTRRTLWATWLLYWKCQQREKWKWPLSIMKTDLTSHLSLKVSGTPEAWIIHRKHCFTPKIKFFYFFKNSRVSNITNIKHT